MMQEGERQKFCGRAWLKPGRPCARRTAQARCRLHGVGFDMCAPYYNNPMADVIYLKKTFPPQG